MATKTKAKTKTCVHCGHTFESNDRWRDLSHPAWHPEASNYCSHECCDQYHRDMANCCSTRAKEKSSRHVR